MAADFKEIGRIKVNDARDVVMSQVIENGTLKGINISSYVRTDGYTGFAKGGVFVPEDKFEEFGGLVVLMLAD